MEFSSIYKPVHAPLSSTEAIIGSMLKDNSSSLAEMVGSHIASSPGKRLRPGLVLLAAGAVLEDDKSLGDDIVNLAAAIELTHMASLIHDDVIDSAPMRHNNPTINSKWQGNIGIIFGDFVYSKAMHLIALCNNNKVYSCLADTVTSMCRGQLDQVSQRHNFQLSKESYLSIIENKTASLFAASCKTGALLGGADEKHVQALSDYGLNFGLAYQMIDDFCDIVEPKTTLGKDPCQDILLGEITLPIMNLIAESSGDQKSEIISLLSSGENNGSLGKIRDLFMASNAPKMTQKAILTHIEKTKQSLLSLNSNECTDSLAGLVDLIAEKMPSES